MATPYSPPASDAAPSVTSEPVDHPRTYAFGRFMVDVPGQRLLRDGEVVPLTGRVFETLLVLIRHRHRVVTKDELLHLVWHDANVSEDSLTHNISILRRTFGDDATQPRFIATSARRGYRFIADVAEGSVPVLVPSMPPAIPKAVDPPMVRRPRWWLIAATVVAAFAIGGIVGARVPERSTTPPLRVLFSLDPPPGHRMVSSGVLSPNGDYVAFVAQDVASGIRRIGVRSIESGDTRMIEGTDGAWRAFWSPDSTTLGFLADSRIKRVGLAADDPPRVIGTTIRSAPPGGSWGTGDIIVYPDAGYLYAIPATGGTPRLLKRIDPTGDQSTLSWPKLMPDGKHLLYSVASNDRGRVGTYFGALSSGTDIRVLPENGEAVAYAAPGHLVFVRNGVVMVQPFDASSGRLTGSPAPAAGRMINNAAVSASSNGLLAFGGGALTEHLTWIDRAGRTIERLDTLAPLHNLVLSHDGSQLLGDSPAIGLGSWLVDLERKVPAQVSTDAARQPHWSPDASRIAFTAQRGDIRGIFVRPSHGGQDELLFKSDEMKFLSDWTRDGRFLVFVSWNQATRQDIWLMPSSGDRQPIPYRRTAAREMQGQVSPDGRWIAYVSDESGRLEVYIDSFPTPGAQITISNGGGGQPQWRADGKELFYLTPDGMMMAVGVTSAATVGVTPARPLFHLTLTRAPSDDRNIYVPAPDGERFLFAVPDIGAEPERINVVANWMVALRRSDARTPLSRLAGLLR